jgi:hypothetical protein
MNRTEFTDNQLINFDKQQLEEMFDWSEVKKLPSTEFEKQRIEWLSRYLVGNVSETFEDIKKQDPADQRRTFFTWIDVVQDVDTLKSMIKSILQETLKDS